MYGAVVSINHQLVTQVPWVDRVPVTWPEQPVPCLVRPLFADGYEEEADGVVVAWSPVAFEVQFSHPDPTTPPTRYKVWLPADRVQPVRDVVGYVAVGE